MKSAIVASSSRLVSLNIAGSQQEHQLTSVQYLHIGTQTRQISTYPGSAGPRTAITCKPVLLSMHSTKLVWEGCPSTNIIRVIRMLTCTPRTTPHLILGRC